MLGPLSLPASEGTRGRSPQGPLGLAAWATRSWCFRAPHSPRGAFRTQTQTAASRGRRPCCSALPIPSLLPPGRQLQRCQVACTPQTSGAPQVWGPALVADKLGMPGPPSHDCRREHAPEPPLPAGFGVWASGPQAAKPSFLPSSGCPGKREGASGLKGLYADASRPSPRSPRVPAGVRGHLKGSPGGWNQWVPGFQW